MDSRITAYLIVALLVGSGVYLGDTLLGMNRTDALKHEVDDLREEVASLNSTLNDLRARNLDLQRNVTSLSKLGLTNRTVKIGYLALEGYAYHDEELYIREIIEPDLNEYASALGYGLRFEFVVELVDSGMALNRMFIDLKQRGVDLVIVGNGNLGVDITLSYAYTNGMVLVSATSNQTDLALGQVAKERLFRLCPWRSYAGTSLADLLWSRGVRSVVALQRGDSWGDGILNDFELVWTKHGGAILGDKVRYDVDTKNYTGYLRQLDGIVAWERQRSDGNDSNIAVVALCQNEAPQVLRQARAYPALMNVTWYGAATTVNSTQIIELAGPEAAIVKWIGLKADTQRGDAYMSLASRYRSLFGRQLDIRSAYLYDCAQLIARSTVEAHSPDGRRVGAAFPVVANATYGATGWCGLNQDHDRIPHPYEVWSYVTYGSNSTIASQIGTLYPASYRSDFIELLGEQSSVQVGP